jgi:cytochrome c oxidase assembly protein subunit 15
MVVGLTRWLGGRSSRRPLAIVGAAELLAGLAIVWWVPTLKGAGHFLAGIGGVVVAAAVIWARNEPAARPLPALGWIAFGLVQLQGLLGGLRVVLYNDAIGIFHATLAQVFFCLLCAIAYLAARSETPVSDGKSNSAGENLAGASASPAPAPAAAPARLRWWIAGTTALVLCQLILGATMRHQHAGLAIPDFPLAYGRWWPPTDDESVARYNQQRIEVTAANPITATQIDLQMAHRILAILILAGVVCSAWQAGGGPADKSKRRRLKRLMWLWVGLVCLQAALGAFTIWTNKAADIATAHVLVGALLLATGTISCIVVFQSPFFARSTRVLSSDCAGSACEAGFPAAGTAAQKS